MAAGLIITMNISPPNVFFFIQLHRVNSKASIKIKWFPRLVPGCYLNSQPQTWSKDEETFTACFIKVIVGASSRKKKRISDL